MNGNDRKIEIIKAGMGIMARQGFNSTGLNAILKEANVPKGSFYHFFPSKQEFGLSVLDHFSTGIERIFASFLLDETLPPMVRFRNCIEKLTAKFESNNCSIGCLAANMGQELADRNEVFRQKLVEIFCSWIGQFEKCLREAQEAGEITDELSPECLALFFLSGFEGGLLLSKVMKSPAPLQNFTTVFFEMLLCQSQEK
jgi:TetR/AcrR family transcriptional repressor of nem operon